MDHTVSVRAVAAPLGPKLPGEFRLWRSILVYACPCGCADIITIPVHPEGNGTWKCDMNPVTPTVHPSIRRLDGCRWHGHLTNGVWSPASDSGQ